MCGITGFWSRTTSLNLAGASAAAREMAMSLARRGPDDMGIWTAEDDCVALAQRRLAIIDLSQAGHQPMFSASGRFVVTYNGEIYNHEELRGMLPEQAWRGHSDTETLLAAIEAWGLEEGLKRLVGMFAIALWDRERRELILARDRMGEKPLYYGWQGGAFLFGSELKALAAFPAWHGRPDRNALTLHLRYGYVPAPHTIWRGIRKLLPGSYIRISGSDDAASLPEPAFYWRASEAVAISVDESIDDVTAIRELDDRLQRSVAGQKIADVPLGAFLSGGVDSSAIVAAMQAQSTKPVRTFTIGFNEDDYNEAGHAKAVAAHLGTDHTELYLSASDALTVIPRLPEIYDEPFGDSSQIPTHLVAAMARQHVTVCLSGDGGDELFGGYNRYVWAPAIWRQLKHLPLPLRSMAGKAIRSMSPQAWDAVGEHMPARWRQPTLGDRLHKLAGVLDTASADELYRRLAFHERSPHSLVIDGDEPPVWSEREAAVFAAGAKGKDFAARMMFQDLVGYLPDDILTKVDRAAMAVGLETRIPMLDHRLVEFAWRLPAHMKVRGGEGKWLLRQVLYRYVPRNLIERPKQGFGVPIDSWLRGPLRDWAEGLLNESRLRQEGWLQPKPIRRRWQEHLSGRRNWQHWLWNVLMFQAWLERWSAGNGSN